MSEYQGAEWKEVWKDEYLNSPMIWALFFLYRKEVAHFGSWFSSISKKFTENSR